MSLVDRLDAAIADLVRVGQQYGITMRPAEAEQIELVDVVAAAIAPYALPVDIQHFYRSWSIDGVRRWLAPELCGLSFALDAWHQHQEDRPPWPTTVLFPIAYSNHWYHMVELDHQGSLGPFVYDCAYAGGRFTLVHSCLAAWFEWVTAELEAGRVVHSTADSASLEVDRPSETSRPSRRQLLRRDGVPESELNDFDDGDRREWPVRWNLADGYDPAAYEPRGATSTIQDFSAALRRGPAQATLHVRWARQSGSIVEVYDDTGFLVMRLPPAGLPFGRGPVWEVDVTGEHQPDLHAPATQDIGPAPEWTDDMDQDPVRIAAFASAAARRWMVPGPPVAQILIGRPFEPTGE